jgi:hypothetical protein
LKKAKKKQNLSPHLLSGNGDWRGEKDFPPIPNERKRQWGMGIHYPPTPKEKEVAKK